MAHISLKLDLDAQEPVSVLLYRNRWGWSHDRVLNFIENSGLELVKIDEENSRSLSILKPTHSRHIADTQPTDNRHIKVIDFSNLEKQTDTKPTDNRHLPDTQPETPNNRDNKSKRESEDPPSPPSSNQDQERDQDDDKQVQKSKYGEFENVLLSNDEKRKLDDEYGGNAGRMIEHMSLYLINNPDRKYMSHYAKIKEWAQEDGKGYIPCADAGSCGGGNDKTALIRASLAEQGIEV